MLVKTNLSTEVTRLLEAGVTRQLNSSIFYSPLRYFYNRFKKNNPHTIDNARQVVQQDVEVILKGIPGFNMAIFVDGDHRATEIGKLFLKRIYNIGINLLKTRLTTRQAFKVVINSNFRMQVYEFILKSIEKAAIDHISKGKIGNSQ